MTDMAILFSLIPLSLVSFKALEKVRPALIWISSVLAGAFHIYWIQSDMSDLSRLIPVAGVLAVFIMDSVLKRGVNGTALLGALFVSQATLSNELPYILLLIAFADIIFCADAYLSAAPSVREQAVPTVLRSIWSLLPAAAGFLLRLEGTPLMICVALTIIFRVSSWPIPGWIFKVGRDRRGFLLGISAAGAFALWKNLSPGSDLDWPATWLCLAAVLSLGGNYRESVVFLSLGIFNLGAPWSFLAIAIWPLLVHEGYLIYFVALLAAVTGGMITVGFQHLFVEEASYAVLFSSALLLARIHASAAVQAGHWLVDGLATVFFVSIVGFVVWQFPEIPIPTQTEPFVFAGLFAFFYIVGKMMIGRKPKLFASIKPLPIPRLKPGPFEAMSLRQNSATQREGTAHPVIERFFAALEGEAYLGFLLGLVGAVLLWGLQ
jgi:hypothetical protein